MYSGTTFHHKSGNIVGVHQRIDRVAKRHLVHHIGVTPFFPSIKTILHFEGKNGPDGIKGKSPSVDEPWHYINPEAGRDDPLITIIQDHMVNLSRALEVRDEVRAGFEAAWLAHAIVDGLTPPHHYPLAEKIEELWGKPHTERLSTKDKIMITGANRRETLAKNWQYWGKGGVFTAHIGFEWGVAAALATGKFKNIGITHKDLERIEREGYIGYFLESVKAVDEMKTYQEYVRTGWSTHLARTVRRKLAPLIMRNVCLAWYAASKGKAE